MSTEETADEHDGASVHGDILESILSHVPLIDLASSSCVSRGWERAVSSSLSHFNSPKPWLLLHFPSSASAAAYDPRSAIWMDINCRHPITPATAPLRSSHSTLLYTLTPSQFSFSIDPLHLKWHHVSPPLTWRTDPIVALVASRLIVVAGTCVFVDEPPAVEIYDLESNTWETYEYLPSIFAEYATAVWYSVAVDDHKLHIMHKSSAAIFSFDPTEKSWAGPYESKPDPNLFSSIIGFAGGEMVVVGLTGSPEDVQSVKIYGVTAAEFSEWREIGEMPKSLVEKLQGESAEMASIGMSWAGDFLFIHHGSDPVEMIQCEVVGGGCRWGSVPNTVVDDRIRLRGLVLTSSNMGIEELKKALRSERPRITIKIKDCVGD
ncbi:F-box/kelch-repeat protein [Cucumis melo var. makuwa]|uniref:F-box/kelch-repeat protein n=3 Tax=Cucumis melo TaxID=3656 RepID=A0A5D3CZK9_CUCMM|nr:F-box/kelch-repeat protein At1g23390 [Cucumis melo]ADN33823.1 F-box/kelch protein [Cucumis melo subsp. melo]KAA0034300.1 F-box/kelch-repeat protein [Cucumis melo var. makuwa]TYK15619.1 F-box/kelch-repeat protein [Cucumis melo var. makuwa]